MIARWIGERLSALVETVLTWLDDSPPAPPVAWSGSRPLPPYEDTDTPAVRARKVLTRLQCAIEYPTTRGTAVPVIKAELLVLLEAYIADARRLMEPCPKCAETAVEVQRILERQDALAHRAEELADATGAPRYGRGKAAKAR